MDRPKIDLPNRFPFSTTMVVRISEINYGQHLGNDAMLGILHEARLRFLNRFGFSESNAGDGIGLIMANLAVEFKFEGRHGMTLLIEVAALNPRRTGFDLVYRVTNPTLDQLIARAKTSMAFYNYEEHKVARMPACFQKVFAE